MLDEQYPNSQFTMSIRNIDQWMKSRLLGIPQARSQLEKSNFYNQIYLVQIFV